VLNGHIDASFRPATRHAGSTATPERHDRRFACCGRGVADMKCGTTFSLITYALLHKHRDRLKAG
jgi:hypothetical protein